MLTFGDLQFAYKADTSTTQCTWAAGEVITYIITMVQIYIHVF